MVFAKISLVLVFFLIPILVQATGVFGSETDHNAYFWCSSTGYDSGDAISGTNVNLPFDGGILLADTGDPFARIDKVYLCALSDNNPNQNSWYILL